MQVDEIVIFEGVQVAAETKKAYLIAVPGLQEVNREHTELGLAMWVPHSQTTDIRETQDETGKRIATIALQGWLVGKKVEEWPNIESCEILLYATSGIEQGVADKIRKRQQKRSKF